MAVGIHKVATEEIIFYMVKPKIGSQFQSCGGVLVGVLFVNGTSATNPILSEKLLESLNPGYGFGLRVMVDKQSRTNIAIDFGFGDKSSGFYLAASEIF